MTATSGGRGRRALVVWVTLVLVASAVGTPVAAAVSGTGATTASDAVRATARPAATAATGGGSASAGAHGAAVAGDASATEAGGAPSAAATPAAGPSTGVVGTPTLPDRRSVAATDPKSTIEGWVFYRDADGNLSPARQTTVIIRKRKPTTLTAKKLKTVRTNDSGYYSAQIDISDEAGANDKLRLRVQALAHNPAVNVVSFAHNQNTANGNTWTINNDGVVNPNEGTATFNFTITGQTERRAFQFANWSLEAYRVNKQKTGWARKRVKLRYPATNDPQAIFKSPLEKIVIGRNHAGERHTTHHEYGHATMSGLFGYKGWQIPKYKKGSHCIWSETSRIYAWYEGFAMFHESVVVDNASSPHPASIESFEFYNLDPSKVSGSSCPSPDQGDFDGAVVEGSTANILWDVYDGTAESHDEMNASLTEVYAAVAAKDNKAWGRISNNARTRDIHDFFIQYIENHPNKHEELRKIYFEYGINKPDRFEHAPGSGPNCEVAEYPCSKLDADKWSKLPVNSSLDLGLHESDEDYYRITVEEEERVTINASVIRRAPNSGGNLVVRVSHSKRSSTVGPRIGNYLNTPTNESVFTANESGTYYIEVAGTNRHTGNLTYNLEINATRPPQTNEEDDTRSEATELTLAPLSEFVNTTRPTAATARYDDDYYEIHLSKGERILHVGVRNGPGLQVAFEDDAGQQLAVAPNGGSLNTTTDPQGTYYFNVSGAARNSEYTLNVTTQHISQKFEENDARSAAADLSSPFQLNPRPAASGGTAPGYRGNPRWCRSTNTGNGNPQTGSNTQQSSSLTQNKECSRHYWVSYAGFTPGFAPHEQDWYFLPVERHQRVNVTIPDDRLGIELYEGSTKVVDVPAGSATRSVEHVATSGGRVYINVTGDEYVPAHELQVYTVHAAGHDGREPNDEKSSATSVSVGAGTTTESYDLLRVSRGDEDYFAVDLDSGDDLNATLTHLKSNGNVTLTVHHPDGSVTEATTLQPAIGGSEAKKRAEVTAGQSGTYYVRVAGDEGTALKYNLTIRTNSSSGVGGDLSVFGPTISREDLMSSLELVVTDSSFVELSLPDEPPVLETDRPCTLHDVETRQRTVENGGGQSMKISRERSFRIDYDDPCKLEAFISGPRKAQVDIYVTLDGSRPTRSNYMFKADGPGSDEQLVIDRPGMLHRGTEVRVLVVGYPVEGDYEVIVEKYSSGDG